MRPTRQTRQTRQTIHESSARILVFVSAKFGQPNPSGCDAYTPMKTEPTDAMTAYVNRLSVLLLAIEMSR